MNFDPTTLVQEAFSLILPALPASWAADITSLTAIIIAVCAIVARHWSRPKEGSRWLWLYQLVNGAAQNRKNAANVADAGSESVKSIGTGRGGTVTGLVLLVGLSGSLMACAETSQGKLRQAVYDLASAYHIMAAPMPDVIAGKVPGVHLTDAQVTLAKRASQSVFNEISALETSIEAGQSATSTAISAAQADLASFTACWSGLKAGDTPAACTAIAGSN